MDLNIITLIRYKFKFSGHSLLNLIFQIKNGKALGQTNQQDTSIDTTTTQADPLRRDVSLVL